MKAHQKSLRHRVTTTTTNEHKLKQTSHLLHGKDNFIFVDSGYHGDNQRDALQPVQAD